MEMGTAVAVCGVCATITAGILKFVPSKQSNGDKAVASALRELKVVMHAGNAAVNGLCLAIKKMDTNLDELVAKARR